MIVRLDEATTHVDVFAPHLAVSMLAAGGVVTSGVMTHAVVAEKVRTILVVGELFTAAVLLVV